MPQQKVITEGDLSQEGKTLLTWVQSIAVTPSQGPQGTVCPGSIRNSIPLWRLSSSCPLEAGALTAPLGWLRPLMCPSRSRSVIFHSCSWSNVSILPTFNSDPLGTTGTWKISSPQSLLGIYRRGSHLERVVAKRELSNLLFVSPIVLHSVWHLFPFFTRDISLLQVFNTKSIQKILVLRFWRIISALQKAHKMLWHHCCC